jgi:hypothetical protein
MLLPNQSEAPKIRSRRVGGFDASLILDQSLATSQIRTTAIVASAHCRLPYGWNVKMAHAQPQQITKWTIVVGTMAITLADWAPRTNLLLKISWNQMRMIEWL